MSTSSTKGVALGFVLMFALLLVNAFLSYRNSRQLVVTEQLVDHTYQVLLETEALYSTLADAETGTRGFTITGDAAYLRPYEFALGKLQLRKTALKQLTSDNPEQQQRIAKVDSLIDDKVQTMQRTIDTRKEQGFEAARQVTLSGEGRLQMDGIREILNDILRVEQGLLTDREQKSHESYVTGIGTNLVATILGLCLVLMAFLLVHRDARIRQRAVEVLERYRVTLASIGDAVVTTDGNGRVTFLNAVAQALTGWNQEQARGLPLEQVFRIVNEQTRQPVENPVTRVLREGQIVGLANHTVLLARDGTERPIDDSAAPIRDAQEKVIGVVLVFRDVTERRQADRELARAAEEKGRLVEELQESDRRKDEFLATLAHELRNPLAPIRNSLQVLRQSEGRPEAVSQVLQIMERQVKQMVHLIDDLLDVSRVSRGKIDLRKERISLAAVLQNAVDTSRPVIEAGRHHLSIALPSEPVYLNADFVRIAQVVSNLLNNAAKYTDEGGRIHLQGEVQGSEAVIRVRDTGIGIPPEMLGRVFDMFVQVDGSLTRSQGGLGIGLTLVHDLVRMHGGKVEAHSEGQNQGSEFIVRLPLAEAHAPASPEPRGPLRHETSAPATGGARRILVVDDNRDSAESLGMLLEMLGHEVRVVHDGPSVLQAALTFRPDVVLLDIGLPGMSGYEVARHLRKEGQLGATVLVAVTGWGQDSDRRRSKDAGFDHHLVKPVDLEILKKVLGAQAVPGDKAVP